MTNRDHRDALHVEIGNIALPAAYDARDLAARVEREIAAPQPGTQRDPIVSAIATRVLAALEASEEIR